MLLTQKKNAGRCQRILRGAIRYIMDTLSTSGNLFTFYGKKCECKIETYYTSDGTEKHRLKLREFPNSIIKFAYTPTHGLVTINTKNGAIDNQDILSDLVSSKPGDLSALVSFFTKYGFFVPVSDTIFETFDAEDIINIHKRLLFILQILANIQHNKIDYMNLYSKICWLTFTPPTQLASSTSNSGIIYRTCKHKFIEYIHEDIPQELPEQNYNELLSGAFYDNPTCDITIKDSIRPPEVHICKNLLMDAMTNENDNSDLKHYANNRPIIPLISLINLFRFTEDIDMNDRFIIEYFYHMETEIGQIIGMDKDDKIIFFKAIESNHKQNFDAALRKSTIKAAKLTIKEEIDYNLSGISPSYNILTMSPSWNIPDLITALFFSIFYMKPNLEIFRKCENPACTKFFLVNTTNSRKKYCSTACANAMAQRMYRKRKKAST